MEDPFGRGIIVIMCTLNVPSETSKEIIKLTEKEQRYWKVLRIRSEQLHSVHYSEFVWKPGVNAARLSSSFPVTIELSQQSKGNLGIHVYKTATDALYRGCDLLGTQRLLIPVYACLKHFVHAEETCALFTQVTITQQDWDKIVESKMKLFRKPIPQICYRVC